MLAPDESYPKGNPQPTPSRRGKYDGLDREKLRTAVWPPTEEDVHRLAYDPRFCRMFGTGAGVMLSQLVFWSGKGHNPDGYLFFTKDGMMERFGLGSRYEVDEARHRLKEAGVLDCAKKARRDEHGVCRWGPSPVLHYRVNLAALAEVLDDFEDDPEGTTASIKRCFKPSKVSGSNATTRPSKPSRVGDSNGRGSAVQSVDGQRFEPSRVSDSNRSRSAALNTESTSETTGIEDSSEINNIELSEGTNPPSAHLIPPNSTEEYHSSLKDTDGIDGDEAHDPQGDEWKRAMTDAVAKLEASGYQGPLLAHARRACGVATGSEDDEAGNAFPDDVRVIQATREAS